MNGPGVDGRVVRADGAGLGDAVLTLVDAAGGQGARASSEPDGRFRLDAPGPGTYQLVVRAPGRPPAVAWVRVGDGRARHDVALLDTAPADASRAPARDASVGRHASEPGRPVG